MPSNNIVQLVSDELPITTLASASYQINGGTAIPGATALADASPFTDIVTVTGLVASDSRIGVKPRDAVQVPSALVLVSAVPGAGTLALTWKNTSTLTITPPAAGVWSVAVLGNYLK